MHPVEFMVRWPGTHRALAPEFSRSRGPAYCSTSWATLLYVTLRVCLSKYPLQNTRQVSVPIPEKRESTWHILHIAVLFEFSLRPPQLRIERDFSGLTKKVKKPSKIPISRNSAKTPDNNGNPLSKKVLASANFSCGGVRSRTTLCAAAR